MKEEFRIVVGKEFHSAGPATSNILFPNCRFAPFIRKSPLEAERSLCLDSKAAHGVTKMISKK